MDLMFFDNYDQGGENADFWRQFAPPLEDRGCSGRPRRGLSDGGRGGAFDLVDMISGMML